MMAAKRTPASGLLRRSDATARASPTFHSQKAASGAHSQVVVTPPMTTWPILKLARPQWIRKSSSAVVRNTSPARQ
jgi:hypothetical protein